MMLDRRTLAVFHGGAVAAFLQQPDIKCITFKSAVALGGVGMRAALAALALRVVHAHV